MIPSAILPEPGPRRALALLTLASATAKGIFLTSGVLYFTEVVDLDALDVGLGLSAAGLVALVLGVLAGRLADRVGPWPVLLASLLVSAAATAAFLLVDGIGTFVAVVVVAVVAQGVLLVARGPLINTIGGTSAQELRAYVRAVTNVGITVGAALAGWAVQLDTTGAYRLLVAADSVFFLVAAALALRLPRPAPLPSRPGPTWTALRDRPYLAVAALDGVLSIQYRVLTVAVPLWIIGHTDAPRWTVSGAVVLNTALVVLLQVRLSRRVDTPRAAGRAMRRAGATLGVASTLIACVSLVPPHQAVLLLAAGIVLHSLGEIWQAAGGFELSNDLAPPHALGQYLGVFGIGMGLAESFAPALLTWLCLGYGVPGWLTVGALFVAAGALAPWAARHAEATRTHRAPAEAAPAPAPAA
ncbi:MFS transporter [Streptomyces filamentosus]|uniref:MFS transporter n=1 Tax=Streptomyces filamentosus TaxID=67294 RepID=UPI003802727F